MNYQCHTGLRMHNKNPVGVLNQNPNKNNILNRQDPQKSILRHIGQTKLHKTPISPSAIFGLS